MNRLEYRRLANASYARIADHAPPEILGEATEILIEVVQEAMTEDRVLHPDHGNPPEHEVSVARNLTQILDARRREGQATWEHVIEGAVAAWLHDTAPVHRITREAIAAAPNVAERERLQLERENSVPLHQIRGAAIAVEIMGIVNARIGREIFVD